MANNRNPYSITKSLSDNNLVLKILEIAEQGEINSKENGKGVLQAAIELGNLTAVNLAIAKGAIVTKADLVLAKPYRGITAALEEALQKSEKVNTSTPQNQ